MNEKGTSPGPHRPREENKGYYENRPYTKGGNLAERTNLFLEHSIKCWHEERETI